MTTITFKGGFWDTAKALKEELLIELGKVIPADKAPDIPHRDGNHQWGDGPVVAHYAPIQLTPKGNRFGDVVRDTLADPDSVLSKVVRNFNAYKKICKCNPEKYSLELAPVGFISLRTKGSGMGRSGVDSFEHTSAFSDMMCWWNSEIRDLRIPPAKYLEGYKN